MANFNTDAPKWDKAFKNSSYNKQRLKKARSGTLSEGGPRGTVYFSDYRNTGKWMKSDRKLRKALHIGALNILMQLKAAVPRGEGTGGHIEDALGVRHVKHGGVYRDRMAFHVYVMLEGNNSPGDQFFYANYASQFSRDAWAQRQKGISTKPNRDSYVDQALDRASIKKARKRRTTASKLRDAQSKRKKSKTRVMDEE